MNTNRQSRPAQVDALFAEWDKPDSPGCAIAIIQNGEIVYKRGYGMADLDHDLPLTPAFVFDIGSIGKQFTAMLILLLAEQGLLTLDDPVRIHLPELPAYCEPITIRHLLHHTSGLCEYTELGSLAGWRWENSHDQAEILDLVVRQQALNFAPGDEHSYSNTGYFLLGVIASRLTGKPFVDLLREQIMLPLGMHATTYTDNPKRIVKECALSYSPDPAGGYSLEIWFCGGYGDGPILSTVEDLLQWDQNFYHNRLGKGDPTLLEQMTTVGKFNNGEPLEYALGLVVGEYKGQQMIHHGGAWAGYRSEMVRFPQQHFSVICLANLTRSAFACKLLISIWLMFCADRKWKLRPTLRAQHNHHRV